MREPAVRLSLNSAHTSTPLYIEFVQVTGTEPDSLPGHIGEQF